MAPEIDHAAGRNSVVGTGPGSAGGTRPPRRRDQRRGRDLAAAGRRRRPARPTLRDNRAVYALARLLLHGRIDHIQCSWVKLGLEQCHQVLAGGVDDLGGTLMEGTISRMAGSQHGSRKSVEDLEAMVHMAGRTPRQRTTTYGTVPLERWQAARGTGAPSLLPLLP